MDLYRYFHPHHNPRLRIVPLRMQELGELEQAATELERALERAALRADNVPVGPISSEHFEQVLIAARYLVDSLKTLTRAHPGDTPEAMTKLLDERAEAPGWETWARLVRQRLNEELAASVRPVRRPEREALAADGTGGGSGDPAEELAAPAPQRSEEEPFLYSAHRSSVSDDTAPSPLARRKA